MVGTLGRLISVHPATRSAEACALTNAGDRQWSAPRCHRNESRNESSCAAAGTYAYGSMPAACTRPSQTYRYRSSLCRAGADTAAIWTPMPPSRIKATASRTDTFRSKKAAVRNAIHPSAMSGSGRMCAGFRLGRTTSSTSPASAASKRQIAATRSPIRSRTFIAPAFRTRSARSAAHPAGAKPG